jgi:hypothetical protein
MPPPSDAGRPSGNGGTGGDPHPDGGMPPRSTGASGGVPGAVGVNGDVKVRGPIDLAGALLVSSPDGITLTGGHVGGNVRSDGPVTTSSPAFVAGDMFSGGNVSGPFMIGGGLHLPATATVGPYVLAPTVTREEVTVPSPCGCQDDPLFDMAGEVTAHAAHNANESVPFTAMFADEIDESQTFDWPCGSFYLSAIRTGPAASLEFRVHGHVAIFVDGDVQLGNNLHVALDPGAELDLVVAGSFISTGRLFGEPNTPAKLRLWVASTTISVGDQMQFGAVVYAPRAVFSAGFSLQMNGSFFVQTVNAADDVNVFYDGMAAAGGQACGLAPPSPIL